ncbi:MAG: aminoglycoside phosphotransferase (APT) family kinase protein [Pseudoalteromonas distincta]|jgi:aminoglycoside phosphotransferase (APT) family kinase protein
MTLTAASEFDAPPAAAALRAAFASQISSPAPVTGGLSGARLFRFEAEGHPWLLRLEGARDDFRDPHRWHVCMKVAAEAGIAPALRYADAESGVCIMAFVKSRPVAEGYSGSHTDMIAAAGTLVRRLHEAPAFPPLVDYLDGMGAVITQLAETGLLAPEALQAELANYGALDHACRRLKPELASSHNDLNPRNILDDGRRLWLVDWESSFLADRYVDLASLANWLTRDEGELGVLTEAYFGRAPHQAEAARLFLARQVNHVFYGVMFLAGVAAERPGLSVQPPAKVANLGEIHQAMGAGHFELDPWEGRLTYGFARLREARMNLESPRFAEAIRLAL